MNDPYHNTGRTGFSICVFCSSSSDVPSVYADSARELGRRIAQEGFRLVFGGAGIGLMGICSDAVAENGGRVTGVIPEHLNRPGIVSGSSHRTIITPDMRSRKAGMEELSDAFIAMPGGYGTMEEIMEILTLKQLQINSSPVVFLNINGYFDPLFSFFDRMEKENFIRPEFRKFYFAASTVEEAMDYIQNYRSAGITTENQTQVKNILQSP